MVLAACTTDENAGEDPADGDDENEVEEADAAEEDEGKVLYLNNGTEPTSLNPSIGFDEVSYDPLNNLMEGLTRLDEDSVVTEGTAEDWEVSDDGLTYTFHLRDD